MLLNHFSIIHLNDLIHIASHKILQFLMTDVDFFNSLYCFLEKIMSPIIFI